MKEREGDVACNIWKEACSCDQNSFDLNPFSDNRKFSREGFIFKETIAMGFRFDYSHAFSYFFYCFKCKTATKGNFLLFNLSQIFVYFIFR